MTPAGLLLLVALAQGALPVETLARQARDDFQAGRYAQARRKLHEALKRSPDNPALWSYLGLTDAQLNDLDAAAEDFKKVLALAPDDAQSFFNLGSLYGRRNEPAKAIEAYRRGLEIEPDNPTANQNYALLLMGQGNFREAIGPLEKLRALDGRNLPAHVALIECYAKSGMKDKADAEIQTFLKLPDASPEECLKLARVLLEDRQPQPARAVLEHVTSIAPESPEAHSDLGILLLNDGRFEDAIRELGRAVQLAPGSSRYSLRLAEGLILWKHYGTALEFLTAVKDRFESLPDYRYKLGLAYYGLHQFPRAIAEFERIAREQPDLDPVRFFLGNCYTAMGDLEKAEAHFRGAIRLQPRNAAYYTALAQVLRKAGDDRTDEAIATLEKALSLDSTDVQAKQELALCHEKNGGYAQAQALLEQVVAAQPELTPAHVALARVYYRQRRKADGDREKAIVLRLQREERTRQAELRDAAALQAR